MSEAPPPSSSRPLLVLGAGALLGLALAAFGLLGDAQVRGPLPDDAVASVNGKLIRKDLYLRLVAGFDADTREAVTPEQRRRLLDRLIDEELLVQRGLELGLAESDRRVRADITAAMIRVALLEAEDEPPTERQLADFHTRERAFFTQPGRLRVAQVFVRAPDTEQQPAAQARAERAHARLLAGVAIAPVRAEFGDPVLPPVPDALLPPAKLREYLGPTLVRALAQLEAGDISAPLRSERGYHIFVMQEREPGRTPPLDEIREQVRTEFLRRADDAALRAYLAALRRAAELHVRAELPDGSP